MPLLLMFFAMPLIRDAAAATRQMLLFYGRFVDAAAAVTLRHAVMKECCCRARRRVMLLRAAICATLRAMSRDAAAAAVTLDRGYASALSVAMPCRRHCCRFIRYAATRC